MWFDLTSSSFIAVLIIIVVFIISRRLLSGGKNLPPGPIPWPVIGNLFSSSGDLCQVTENLRQKYGDVYSLYLDNVLTVFVHGYDNLKEVLVTRGDEFAGRPKLFLIEAINGGKGLVMSTGDTWKEQRRFSLHTLRNFGFGKSSLEEKVIEEVQVVIKYLTEKNQEAFCMEKLLHTSMANIICSIVFGNRFEHDDPKFTRYMHCVEENFSTVGLTGILNFLPWLRYLPGDLFKYNRTMRNAKIVEDFFRSEIKHHKDSLDLDNPRDFIDAYLIEMKRAQEADPNTSFEDEQMLKVIGDLFIAGSESTSTALLWSLVFLINNPDVQTKLREEIHMVVGKSRFPSMADRKNMPYAEATLMEIQRCGDIVPFNVAHSATVDTSLHGYNIPRGTTVVPMLTTLLKDPTLWKNPERFDPNRFLNLDGQFVKSEKSIPFSAGKRVCLGESLARMELFLFLTSMLQKFVFKAPEGVTMLNPNAVVGLTRYPEPFELRAIVDI